MDQICYQAHQRISISIEFTSQTHRRSHKNTSLKGDATPFTPNEGPVGPSQNVHQRGDTPVEPHTPGHGGTSTWSPGGSHVTMHRSWCAPPPLAACSAGSADRAAWRNPLSRHFSFPLTDGPWRARAFGPPAWLAARQLNKLSSCYNSLKHFQLPQSNKSCRRALGRLPTRSASPAGAFPLVCLALRHATESRSGCSAPNRRARRRGKWKGAILMIWEFSSSFCSLPLLRGGLFRVFVSETFKTGAVKH